MVAAVCDPKLTVVGAVRSVSQLRCTSVWYVYGGRGCFGVSAPLASNRLPPEISNNQSLEKSLFKSQLKTHLFNCID